MHAIWDFLSVACARPIIVPALGLWLNQQHSNNSSLGIQDERHRTDILVYCPLLATVHCCSFFYHLILSQLFVLPHIFALVSSLGLGSCVPLRGREETCVYTRAPLAWCRTQFPTISPTVKLNTAGNDSVSFWKCQRFRNNFEPTM